MKDYQYLQAHGIHFLKVHGSAPYRARIHGRVLKEQILAGPVPKLGEINDWIIKRSEGPVDWPFVRPALLYLYNNVLMPKLEASTQRIAPEQVEVFKAIAEETGLPRNLVRNALFQADGIMVLSRLGMMKYLIKDMPPACLPCCSSTVAYGPFSEDGRVMHARNQDYPIVGRWEPYPLVFFHSPTESNEIPFISITSCGVQTGGLTSINREGITLATHAHFGTEITTDGLPIMVLGEIVISRAKTIDQAIDIAKSYKRNANWTFIISSHKEKRAVALEMTPTRVVVREALEGGRLTHTNYFQSPSLSDQEALFSASVLEDLYGRRLRMDQFVAQSKGKVGPQNLMAMLGDHHDYYSNSERIFGNTISVVTTIKSVVFDGGMDKFYISTRHRSPVGLGPFAEINMEQWWDSDWSKMPLPVLHHPKTAETRAPHFEAALHQYREAYRYHHIESDRTDYMQKTTEHLEAAYRLIPEDPHVGLQWALLLFKQERFQESEKILDKVLTQSLTLHLNGVAKLFKARCLDLEGKRDEALIIYKATFELMKEPGLRDALKKGIKRSYKKKMLTELMLDLQFPAPHHY